MCKLYLKVLYYKKKAERNLPAPRIDMMHMEIASSKMMGNCKKKKKKITFDFISDSVTFADTDFVLH